MSGVQLGGRESDLTIPECGLCSLWFGHHVGLGGVHGGMDGRWGVLLVSLLALIEL